MSERQAIKLDDLLSYKLQIIRDYLLEEEFQLFWDYVSPWFQARSEVSLGAVEGLNNKLKTSIRGSYGFRSANAIKIMLYHKLGQLPERRLTHRFC